MEIGGVKVVVVNSETEVIQDTASALDFLMTIIYDMDSTRVAINKEAVCESFFVLSSGVAGEILQKFINYGSKIAIIGDFSRYTSKPLRDFIYESNNGRDIFFVATEDEAIEKLAQA